MFEDDPLWYKDAVVYELHVKAFYDSNNDGIGDFRGLIDKLDYLQDLGVNTLWLLPFYPSPQRDDGYDISDYRNIHPDYGSMADFRRFVREAHQRGLRVITELVINHTSDQHPWFQAARSAPPKSMKRNYYVWSDDDKKFPETRIIFTDSEKSNWAWDDVAQAYYWHRFFSHQPDLNHNNPHVVKAMIHVMRFWFDAGVDGMRLDAVPYLCVREGSSNENLPETHAVIKHMRAELDQHYQNRMLLAEANQWPEDVRDYFGDGDECHMAYHFPLMPRIYMAIAQEDRHPIVEIMQQTPDIPTNCQWAIFLRNHDELTLEMVTDRERDYMYQMYTTDIRARVNVGIRRRLAPLMENDHDKIRLINSLLLSMPGSPIIYYGDEIGMGDNYYLGDRHGVRTPMQWSPERNAGFSRADPQRLYQAPIMDAVYGHEALNVEAQLRNPSSLLNWMRRMLAVRKSHQGFGRGSLNFLRANNRKVFAYLRSYGDEVILCVANLSRAAQPVELDLGMYKGRVPLELLGRTPFPPIGALPYLLTLPGHGFYWFLLAGDKGWDDTLEERVPHEEVPLLVLFDGWRSLFRDRVVPWRIAMAEQLRAKLEQETLPSFIAAQRWYSGAVQRAMLVDQVEWALAENHLLGLFRLEGADRNSLYFLPLSLHWESDEESVHTAVIARIRQQSHTGLINDAWADAGYCRGLVQAIGDELQLPCERGSIRFMPTAAFARCCDAEIATLPVSWPPTAKGSYSVAAIGRCVYLKGYRRLYPGLHPAIEIGQYLTRNGFPHAPLTLGTVEYQDADGQLMTLCWVQGYVENQGDFWSYTLDYLAHFLEECGDAERPVLAAEIAHQAYLVLVRTLAQRTAQLHAALADAAGEAEFTPEPVSAADMAGWARAVRDAVATVLEPLAAGLADLPDNIRNEVEALLAQRPALEARIERAGAVHVMAAKIRCHGDYHLRQVLINQNDFVITDREDEPVRPYAERRRKHSPMRDVAQLLQSLQLAGTTALLQASTERPESYEQLEPLVRDWAVEAVRVFVDGYQEYARDGQLYASWDDMRGLLELFRIEQAFRQLRYDREFRPEWVGLSARGIRQLMQ